jgi:hypothetical protein
MSLKEQKDVMLVHFRFGSTVIDSYSLALVYYVLSCLASTVFTVVLIIIVFPLGMQGPTAIMKAKMLAPNQQKCKNTTNFVAKERDAD